MLNIILAGFYERDLNKLIDEINLFKSEEDLWKTCGTIANSRGNLVLHLIGGMNYLIGTHMVRTGYVRDRDKEFTIKGIERDSLVSQLKDLIILIKGALLSLSPEQMEAEYPLVFDDAKRSHTYLLVQLLAHLNYHLGQVNYLRRSLA